MQDSFLDVIFKSAPFLLKGALTTIWISLLAIFLGTLFGAFMATLDCHKMRHRILSPILRVYINLFRGTPLFIQLLLIYFALPEAIGIELSPIEAGLITLSLNSTAYLAEIMRAGINSIDDGQWDASYILGYTKIQTLIHIILPQAFRNVMPALTNEFATLIKESSILMVIGVPELIKNSKDIVANNLKPMEIYTATALLYLLMTMGISFFTKHLEKRGA